MQFVHNLDLKKLAISCSISLGSGLVSSLISIPGFIKFKEVKQPPLSPPDYIFPIVWTVLYLLMGVSAYLIYKNNTVNYQTKKTALITYALQLAVNFFWSIIFFNAQAYLFAFVWILLLLVLIIFMIYQFWHINKLAAIINIPYLLWVAFASYLTLGVYILN